MSAGTRLKDELFWLYVNLEIKVKFVIISFKFLTYSHNKLNKNFALLLLELRDKLFFNKNLG